MLPSQKHLNMLKRYQYDQEIIQNKDIVWKLEFKIINFYNKHIQKFLRDNLEKFCDKCYFL